MVSQLLANNSCFHVIPIVSAQCGPPVAAMLKVHFHQSFMIVGANTNQANITTGRSYNYVGVKRIAISGSQNRMCYVLIHLILALSV